ncbi:substrate-binding periplasmic protein [Pseudoalteromonas sp. S16_S37]|uniref:substrate-binding periplasmic protein n=1 Tax=Pseudoalteromonas sp. S16_S37 TaxID=2720228 RepID=UPI0016818E1F|nr:transporter substrate-binding domain-containing protein [Pseudoalteromonas sp. S16_S37]MBD1584122.1 amino acid ABC transporter substrate-binding protein [Pseudoalteromonas sp. S16_S37]
MWLLLFSLHNRAAAEPLKVAFGQSRPPYVDESNQSGISVELFDNIAKISGWQYQSFFVSNKRMERLLRSEKVDIAVEVQKSDKNLYYSMPLISYRNFAFHRNKSKFVLNNMSELLVYSVCAWQNASEHLFLDSTFANKTNYVEYSKQQDQVIDWLSGKCEVILIDDTLLKWHLFQLKNAGHFFVKRNWGKVLLPVKNNPLWFYAGFREPRLRDDFNSALQLLIDSGRYNQIREMIE